MNVIPVLLALSFAAITSSAHAGVKLPAVISDHMVLQREMAVPIWGTALPAEEVSVSIAGQTKKATADAEGRWKVMLDPLKVGEPLEMTVQGKETLTIKDVLVGEVWLGSGQSNMGGTVRGFKVNDPGLVKIYE